MNLKNTQTSIALDLLRAIAAQAVCVGHAIGLFEVALWAQPPHVPYMQNIAVLVFFLLSGFLIAYTLDTRSQNPSYGFQDYFIERFARIYSALVPALITIALIDFIAGSYKSTFVSDFIGSLFMMPDVHHPIRMMLGSFPLSLSVGSLGTAGQLWTLAIEWHIYLFVGALFFVRRSLWMPLLAIIFCLVPLAYFRRVQGQDFGHGVTALWFCGFATYYALPHLVRIPTWIKAAAVLVFTAAYFYAVPPEHEFTRNTYPLLVAAFVAFVSLTSGFKNLPNGIVSRSIRFAAGYSFTLYLIHNSVVKAVWKLWSGDPYLVAVLAIVAANLLAIAIAIYTEMRHKELARFLRTHTRYSFSRHRKYLFRLL